MLPHSEAQHRADLAHWYQILIDVTRPTRPRRHPPVLVAKPEPAAAPALSGEALDRLAAARRQVAAFEALAELAGMFGLGRWAVAGEIARRLAHFENGAAWSRIRRGGRPPAGRIEELLAALAACPPPSLPRTRDRLHRLLR